MARIDRSLLEQLRLAPVGARIVPAEGVEPVQVHATSPAQYPCWRCVFLPLKEGHVQCPLLRACAGRYRPDRRSVRFVKPDGRKKNKFK